MVGNASLLPVRQMTGLSTVAHGWPNAAFSDIEASPRIILWIHRKVVLTSGLLFRSRPKDRSTVSLTGGKLQIWGTIGEVPAGTTFLLARASPVYLTIGPILVKRTPACTGLLTFPEMAPPAPSFQRRMPRTYLRPARADATLRYFIS